MLLSKSDVLGGAVAVPAVASVAVLLRFCVRHFKKAIGIDDWLILLALGLTWGMSAVLLVGVMIHSFGTYISVVPPTAEDMKASLRAAQNSIKLLYTFSLAMILALALIKLSVIHFYRRMFTGITFKAYSRILYAIVILWCLAFLVAQIFHCGMHPFYWWTSEYTDNYLCFKAGAFEIAFSATDIILDLFILAIPIPIVRNLRMSTAKKGGILFVFLLGFLSTAGAITRLVVHSLIIYDDSTHSVLGKQGNIEIWTIVTLVEASLAIIAACLPILRSLLPKELRFGPSIKSIFSFRLGGSNARRGGRSPEHIRLPDEESPQRGIELDRLA